MNPGLLVHDARRVWTSARRYRAERRGARRVDLGLAFFEAVERAAVAGRPARYRVGVTDLGPAPRSVRLVLEFWLPGVSDPAAGRAAHLVCDLITRPRSRLEAEIVTDRLREARAWCEGAPLRCHLLPGPTPAAACYTVLLTLREGEEIVDQIVARQRLEPAGP